MLHRATFVRIVIVGVALGAATSGCARTPGPAPSTESRDIRLTPDGPSVEARVPANATLETLLKKHELPAETTGSLMKAVSEVFNPRQLRANQQYRISRTIDGLIKEFRYQIDPDRLLRVIARPSADASPAFSAEVVTLPKIYALDAMVGEIGRGDSLIGVLDAAGENEQLALSLAAIFGGEV